MLGKLSPATAGEAPRLPGLVGGHVEPGQHGDGLNEEEGSAVGREPGYHATAPDLLKPAGCPGQGSQFRGPHRVFRGFPHLLTLCLASTAHGRLADELAAQLGHDIGDAALGGARL